MAELELESAMRDGWMDGFLEVGVVLEERRERLSLR
jgi:hypothetical protein